MKSIQNTAKRLAAKRGQDEGFTLIELLVVIIILGVLAAVVVFSVGGLDDTAQDAACAADLSTVEIAVEAFRANTGAYPGAMGDITPEYLRNPSTLHSVGAGGAVAAIGDCA